MDSNTYTPVAEVLEERPLWPAIRRGMLNTCPACGSSRLFRAYLKPVDACESCSSEMHHHRADDLPPYLVVFVTGHVLLTFYMLTENWMPEALWLQFAIWIPFTIIVSLLIIQPIKGGVIGLQWALRMHGFGGVDPNDPVEEVSAGE